MRRKLWKKILFETSAQPQQNIGMSRHLRKQTIRIARNIAMASYMLSVSQNWNHHFPVGKEIHAHPLSQNDCHPWPLKVHHSYCIAFLSARKTQKKKGGRKNFLARDFRCVARTRKMYNTGGFQTHSSWHPSLTVGSYLWKANNWRRFAKLRDTQCQVLMCGPFPNVSETDCPVKRV